MAASPGAAVTVSVDDVVALTDAELDQFILKHRMPNGDINLPVDGWDKLSREERGCLAERLEARRRGLAAVSRPLDLDELDARLRQVAPQESISLRPEPQDFDQAGDKTPPIDPDAHLTREIDAYNELVNDGGRPLYPIDLVREVCSDPDKYADMLRPWQATLTEIWAEDIFQRQLQRWQDFRKWQNDNRGREDDDCGFLAYVEKKKRWIEEDYLPSSRDRLLAQIEADPFCLKEEWDEVQFLRRRHRRLYRERGCRGFPDYVEAVTRRLSRHGFTRPIMLNEDPKTQGKLATWIEYLNYEYWWLDKHTSDIDRLAPEHDKLWQELVDKKILRPHETKEYVRTTASGMELDTERRQAMQAVQRAESEAKRILAAAQEGPKHSRSSSQEQRLSMTDSTKTLLSAKRWLEQAKNRSFLIVQFVRATFGWARAKRGAAIHSLLVQWVLDQVPLVEAEIDPSMVGGSGSDTTRVANGRAVKRKQASHTELSEAGSPKRVKLDTREPSKASQTHAEPGEDGAAQVSEPVDPTAGLLHGEALEPTLPGRRCSARIAARRGFPRMKTKHDASQPSSGPRSKTTFA